MKHKNAVLYFTTGLIIVMLAIFFSFFLLSKNADANSDTISAVKQAYLLKEYEGKIALFTPPYEVPETVYDVYLNTLPEQDQIQLKLGISIADEQELKNYISDFDS